MVKAKTTTGSSEDVSKYKTQPISRDALTEKNCFQIFKVKFLPENATLVLPVEELGQDSTVISFLEAYMNSFIEAGKPIITARFWWDEQANDIVMNPASHSYSPVTSDIRHTPLVHEEVQSGKQRIDYILSCPQEGFEYQGPFTPVEKLLICKVIYS